MRSFMTLALIVIAFVVLLLGAGEYFARHDVPRGQPPLVQLTSASFDSLKVEFNRSSDGLRIILLLSPT
jgi:hypothetical protein